MSKKVLIFEDNKFVAKLIKYYLEEDGYKVRISLSMDNFF